MRLQIRPSGFYLVWDGKEMSITYKEALMIADRYASAPEELDATAEEGARLAKAIREGAASWLRLKLGSQSAGGDN